MLLYQDGTVPVVKLDPFNATATFVVEVTVPVISAVTPGEGPVTPEFCHAISLFR